MNKLYSNVYTKLLDKMISNNEIVKIVELSNFVKHSENLFDDIFNDRIEEIVEIFVRKNCKKELLRKFLNNYNKYYLISGFNEFPLYVHTNINKLFREFSYYHEIIIDFNFDVITKLNIDMESKSYLLNRVASYIKKRKDIMRFIKKLKQIKFPINLKEKQLRTLFYDIVPDKLTPKEYIYIIKNYKIFMIL